MKHDSWEEHQQSRRAERRQAFQQRLRELAGRLYDCRSIDEIKLHASAEIAALFGCERLTLYTIGESRMTVEAKVKTGMDTFKNFTMPIAHSSIAGHVALTRKLLNIHDVYDGDELRNLSRELRFLDVVDRRTQFRSKEMVVAPIVNAANGELLGVVQLINNRLGGPFPEDVEEGVRELCKILAVAFERRSRPEQVVHSRFDPLVVLGMLSRPELELAKLTSRRKRLELEDVLFDEFQISLEQMGAAYASFFGVAYEPFRAGRSAPPLMERLKREYALTSGWLLLEAGADTLTVLALDPGHLRASRNVEQLFPAYSVELRVCSRREFMATLEQLYGMQNEADADANEDLLRRLQKIVASALDAAAPELKAVVRLDEAQPRGAEAGGRLQLVLRVDLTPP